MDREPFHLLLVEDDEGYARLVPRALTRANLTFELMHVVSLDQALSRLEAGTFDAILLDLSLPDSDGLDTFIRVQLAAPEIPIIVLTAVDDKSLALSAVKSGAQDYLVKGLVDLQWLSRTIRYAIERQNAQTEQNRRIARLALLRDVDDELTRRLDIGYVLTMAMDTALRLSAASAGIIGLLDDDGVLVKTENINYDPRLLDGIPLMDTGIVGRALRTHQAQLVPDVSQDPDFVRLIKETQAQISIPLVSQDRLVGILNLETRNPRRFNDETFEFLKLLAARIATSVDNARLYDQSQNQLEQLRQLEQLKTDMIRIATHDLRTPLSNIMGYAYLLRQVLTEIDPDTCQYIDAIEHSAERMRGITDDILSLERVESMKHLKVMPVNLNELVQRAYYESRDRALQKNQRFELDIARRPVIVEGDPSLLYEAMANLVTNAIKYTPQGGRVDVRLAVGQDDVAVEVVDTGYGIPADQQARLFQPFFRARTDETVDIDGTGLGLHLVKNIIERHAGQIIFHSEYGRGSTFGFRLPLGENN